MRSFQFLETSLQLLETWFHLGMFPIEMETFPIQVEMLLNWLETNVAQIMLCYTKGRIKGLIYFAGD